MPTKPPSPCRHQGCAALTHDRYCEKHKREEHQNYNRYHRDKNQDAFYKSRQWQSLRRQKLAVAPYCEECHRGGRYQAATVVDHITPIKHGGAPLEMANLQSLCASCHSTKSAKEGSRWGRRTGGDFEN